MVDHYYLPNEEDRSNFRRLVDLLQLHIESVGLYREIHPLFLVLIDKYPIELYPKLWNFSRPADSLGKVFLEWHQGKKFSPLEAEKFRAGPGPAPFISPQGHH